VTWLVAGRDSGLGGAEPDGAAVPLPSERPLNEGDVAHVRFDTTMRGYRMGQVDAALRRAAYDIGYKQELINVLEAEVEALRDGRPDDAEALRRARTGAAPKPLDRPAIAPATDRPPIDLAWAGASAAEPASDDDDDDNDAEHEASDEAVNSANGAK
jgi:DivIVA domain-containing protein